MALDEIRLWAMDGSGGATPLSSAGQTESEQLLEKTLVNNPDMLMPGLTLVGRQTRTEGGPLDLLGVDPDGRLTLFELKRGSLNRDAVAQIIDYASFLEAMDDETLARHITDYSGRHGIDNIDDFGRWYGENRSGLELSEMRPIRLVLVGLGVDDATTRMVQFLAKKDVEISLLTFHGFNESGRILLARQVQVKPEMASTPSTRTMQSRPPQRELIERVENRIKQSEEQWEEGCLLWKAIRQMFQETFGNFRERVSRSASDWALYRINFSLRRPRGRMQAAAVQLSLEGLHPWGQCVEVIFFPSAVQLRLAEFTQLRREIPYITYPPNDPAKESGVLEVKFMMKSMSDWETYKEKLTAIARSVFEANEANLEGEDD